jgi:hypothetical protein
MLSRVLTISLIPHLAAKQTGGRVFAFLASAYYSLFKNCHLPSFL